MAPSVCRSLGRWATLTALFAPIDITLGQTTPIAPSPTPIAPSPVAPVAKPLTPAIAGYILPPPPPTPLVENGNTLDIMQGPDHEPIRDASESWEPFDATKYQSDSEYKCVYDRFLRTGLLETMRQSSLPEYNDYLCCKRNVTRACYTKTRPRVSVYKAQGNVSDILLNGKEIPLFRQNIYMLRENMLRTSLDEMAVYRVHNPGPPGRIAPGSETDKVRRLVFYTSLRMVRAEGIWSASALLAVAQLRAMMELHAVESARSNIPVIVDLYVVHNVHIPQTLLAAAHYDLYITTENPDPLRLDPAVHEKLALATGIYYTVSETKDHTPGPNFPVHRPDLVLVRTEELPMLAHTSLIQDLTPFIENHTLMTEELITKNFGEPHARDFHYQEPGKSRGSFYAFPIMGTSLGLIYNKTTLDALGYKYVPGSKASAREGFHMPVQEWTWEKLVEISLKIKQKYNQPGFFFDPGIHEEASLVQVIAMQARVPLFAAVPSSGNDSDAKLSCGLTHPTLLAKLTNTLGRLRDSGTWDISVQDPDQNSYSANGAGLKSEFRSFLKNYPDVPFPSNSEVYHDANFNLIKPDGNKPILGFVLMRGFGAIPLDWFGENPKSNLDMRFGMIPGGLNIFSGMGVSMAPRPRDSQLAWAMIGLMNSARDYDDYASQLAFNYGWAPLRQDVWSMQTWQYDSGRNDTGGYDYLQVQALAHSLPLGYPVNLPQESLNRLANYKPFRTMFVEMLYLNQSIEVAARNACDAINLDYMPQCTEGVHYMRVVEENCDSSTATLRGVYVWINFEQNGQSGYRLNQNMNERRPCNGSLPNNGEPFAIDCPFVGRTHDTAIAVYTLCSIGIVFSVVVGLLLFVYREHRAIRSASLLFCELIVLGSILVQAAPFLFPGTPDYARIHAGIWLLCLGICLIFAALLAKTYRVHQIFISARLVRSLRITDRKLMAPFLALVAGEVLLLCLFTFFPNADTVVVDPLSMTLFPGTATTYNFSVVTVGMKSFGVVLILYNGLLILAACILSYSVRRVPSQFRESSLLFVCIYLLALMVFVIGVLTFTYTVEDGSSADRHDAAEILYLALGVCVFLCMSLTNALLFVPKILTVWDITLFSAHSSLSSRSAKDRKADSYNRAISAPPQNDGGYNSATLANQETRSGDSNIELRNANTATTVRELTLLREVEDLHLVVATMKEKLVRLANPHFNALGLNLQSGAQMSASNSDGFSMHSAGDTNNRTAGKRSTSNLAPDLKRAAGIPSVVEATSSNTAPILDGDNGSPSTSDPMKKAEDEGVPTDATAVDVGGSKESSPLELTSPKQKGKRATFQLSPRSTVAGGR